LSAFSSPALVEGRSIRSASPRSAATRVPSLTTDAELLAAEPARVLDEHARVAARVADVADAPAIFPWTGRRRIELGDAAGVEIFLLLSVSASSAIFFTPASSSAPSPIEIGARPSRWVVLDLLGAHQLVHDRWLYCRAAA